MTLKESRNCAGDTSNRLKSKNVMSLLMTITPSPAVSYSIAQMNCPSRGSWLTSLEICLTQGT